MLGPVLRVILVFTALGIVSFIVLLGNPEPLVHTPKESTEAINVPLPQTTTSTQKVTQTSPPPAPLPEPLEQESAKLSFNVIDLQTRGAVVSIICTHKSPGKLQVISGSGVIIDPRGVVLTNAHVAQFWLLPRKNPLGTTECSMRTTTPSKHIYTAEPLFFPTSWIALHAEDIDNKNPRGTGEYDYALLRITDTVDGEELPSVFPFVSFSIDESSIEEEDGVVIAGYPSSDADADLEALSRTTVTSTLALIRKIYTFEGRTVDIISLGGTALSYKGASGGAVVNNDNELIGIIVTSTEGGTAAERDLRALTLAHINRSLVREIGEGFTSLLSGNIEAKAALFNQMRAPQLTQLLLSELE
jgi:hypothetical protein